MVYWGKRSSEDKTVVTRHGEKRTSRYGQQIVRHNKAKKNVFV